MKYLPYENFYIITSLTPVEVHESMQNSIKLSRSSSFAQTFEGPSAHYFTGYSSLEYFLMIPQIAYRNAFIPQIEGKVESYLNGSRIHVTMRIIPVFFGIWCLLLVGGGIMGLCAFYEGSGSTAVAIPLLIIVIAYCVAVYAFKSESFDARYRLADILEGELE